MKLINLNKKYGNSSLTVHALQNVSCDFKTFGLTVITGKSGCGKTTLLYTMAGLTNCDSGQIIELDNELTGMSEKEWDDYRNENIGFIFQDYKLIEKKTVRDNLEIALDIQNQSNHDLKINDVLQTVGLPGFEKRKVCELSGGQKQRIAIARALIKECKIILADEPTGNLDAETSSQIWALLKRISEQKLVIAVTHDKETAAKFADNLIEMADGKIINYSQLGEHLQLIVSYDGMLKKLEREDEIFDFLCSLCMNGHTDLQLTLDNNASIKSSASCQQIRKQNIMGIKSLSLKNKIKFTIQSWRQRTVKHILSVIMFSVALLLALVISTVFLYNYGDSVERYIKKYNFNQAEFSYKAEYVNGFLEKTTNALTKGPFLLSALSDSFGADNIIGADRNSFLMSTDHLRKTSLSFLFTEKGLPLKIEGRYPQKSSEIVLTDYVASLLGIENPIGTTVCSALNEFVVVGVLKTDYEDYKVEQKIFSQELSQYGYYKLENEYKIAILFDNREKEKDLLETLVLPSTDFTVEKKLSSYISSELTFSCEKKTSNCQMIAGRMPQNKNEIAISSSLMQQMGKNIIDFENNNEITANFWNIGDEKYNNCYSDRINLFDYFPEGALIVGVFDGASSESDVILPENIWEEIVYAWSEAFYYSTYLVRLNESKQGFGKKINQYNLTWDEPSANEMLNLQDVIVYLKPFVIAAFLVVLLLAMIMMVNCVSISITDSSELIGILRAIGVRKKDTFMIFFFEMVSMVICSGIITTVCYLLTINWINTYISRSHAEKPFDVFPFSYSFIPIMFLISILVGAIAVLYPVRQLSKKKPMELLKTTL